MNTIKIRLLMVMFLTYTSTAIADSALEAPLKNGISAIVAQKIGQGLSQMNALADQYPNFKLAQLVKADLLSYRSGQHFIKNLKNPILTTDVYDELQARLKDDDVAKKKLYPSEVIYLGQHYPHVLVADISRSRLYVYNNGMTLVNSFYMSVGRAGAGKERVNDGKTPLGIYFIDKRIAGDALPDKYGEAAYPLNYPNTWDKIKGKTGHGIWLHGTTKASYSRVPNATEGCISLANDDMKAIEQYITDNTPIIIGNPVKWTTHRVAMNNTAFLKEFRALNNDTRNIVAKTDAVPNSPLVVNNEQENFNNLSLINGPENEMMVATFLQQQADKTTRVEQYWKNTSKGWEVVSETGS